MRDLRSNKPGGKPDPATVRNTLGIGGPAYERLIEKLNDDSDYSKPDPQRVFSRVAFVDPFVRVLIEGENSVRREMILACRNLSRGGVGLLHSTFMYPGTQMTVFLQRFDGTSPGLRGKVVRIQHRGGVVHEIGVKFDREINPRDYMSNDITDVSPSFERVAPEKLKGDVLFVNSSDEIKAQARQFLLETSLKFRFVDTLADAMTECDKPQDMILIDLDFKEMSGPELIKKMRIHGINCPIALIGTPGLGLSKSMVKVCGADSLIKTPMTQDALLRTLGEFILSAWDLNQLDKSRSRVDRATLVSLCFELNKLGVVMDQQLRVGDRVAIFGTCQKIRGLTLLVGMSGVAGMAERLAEKVADTTDLAELEELIEQVRLGCSAAGRAAA